MKHLVLILALVLGAAKVNAQFFNPYMPNVSPEMVLSMSNAQLEMMQNAHLAQMRAQTNALYMQNMQMLQARTAAAYNNLMNFQFTPVVPSAPIQTTTVTTREKVICPSCRGTKRVTRKKYDYSLKREVTRNEICSECHGKGYDRE